MGDTPGILTLEDWELFLERVAGFEPVLFGDTSITSTGRYLPKWSDMADEAKVGEQFAGGVIHAVQGVNAIVRMPDGSYKLVPLTELKE